MFSAIDVTTVQQSCARGGLALIFIIHRAAVVPTPRLLLCTQWKSNTDQL